MPDVVYRTMTAICGLVASLPVATNLGLLQLLWMLVSGQLLATRGAVVPGLDACGLARRAVRRAWAALGPRSRHPWLLASPLALTPQALHALYHDRWPVEQLPLMAKHLLGAARQFVHAPRPGQQLPVLALLAGAILAYVAATAPASPTGFWDRQPRPTAGACDACWHASLFRKTSPGPRAFA